MGLLKWKNEDGLGIERNALNRGRSILTRFRTDVEDGIGDRNQTFGIRNFNQLGSFGQRTRWTDFDFFDRKTYSNVLKT